MWPFSWSMFECRWEDVAIFNLPAIFLAFILGFSRIYCFSASSKSVVVIIMVAAAGVNVYTFHSAVYLCSTQGILGRCASFN